MRRSLVALSLASAALACRTTPTLSPTPPSPQPTEAPTADAPPAKRPSGGASMSSSSPVPPIAAVRRVTDSYHGVEVVDRYRWLEADGDPEVKAWSEAQNRYARSVLDRLPGLATIKTELRDYLTAPLTRYGSFKPAGGKLFALRRLPTAQQMDLVVMTSPEAAADATLVLDPTGGGATPTRAIDWFVPSPDGTRLAVSISEGGSEAGTLHLVGLDGVDLEPPIPDVQHGTGGGDAAWSPDGKVLYYTRYPAKGEKPDDERAFWQQVWAHTLGTPREKDRLELGKDFGKVWQTRLESDVRGRVLASVQDGDGGTFRHYLRAPGGGWKRLTDWKDGVTFLTLGTGNDLFGVSIKGAPRGQLLRWPALGGKIGKPKVIVPEGDGALATWFYDDDGIVVTRDRLYAVVQQGGPMVMRAYTLAGKPVQLPRLPPVATVALANRPLGDDVLVGAGTYVEPWQWSRLSPRGELTPLPAISPRPPGSLAGWEVRRELATSRDGTKVPLNVVWKTGAPRDGSVPCLVTGYGGFGISQTPSYLGTFQPLLRRGMCFVEVNLRGGGEFGEDWHQAGALTRKQNVFDDFIAALEYLHGQKYTSPEHTVIIGGSNGGLLMGAVVTQRPELMKAAVAEVGIYDMLRVETTTNGQFNVPELGTVKDKAQFEALHAYSPYHRVKKGTRYPAMLFTTGANDPRVAPWQSRKMVAALQEAQEGSAPILLRTSDSAGHGSGTSLDEQIESSAHVQTFILWQAGLAR